MLRYSLLLNPDEHVALFKEINYIAKFLKIQKCLHSEVFYEFNQEGSLEGKKIIPRLLIWLVENAFKHGQIMNKDFPIRMNLNSGPERIVFSVQNRKHLNKTVVKCGIGNRNIDQILELFYHGKYDLKVRESDHDYSVELSLKI
jgi:two-component system LytT family sensor kinase